jgi:RhoGAP domain
MRISTKSIVTCREAFERNSRAVELSPDHVPDINVITGVLKDYLRELPEPLFTKCLFQMTVDALGKSGFRCLVLDQKTWNFIIL